VDERAVTAEHTSVEAYRSCPCAENISKVSRWAGAKVSWGNSPLEAQFIVIAIDT